MKNIDQIFLCREIKETPKRNIKIQYKQQWDSLKRQMINMNTGFEETDDKLT